MQPEKPYFEAFFIGVATNSGVGVFPISQDVYHALEGVVAEVAIPCNLPDAGYCFVVMLVYLPNHEPAIFEMMNLQDNAESIVHEFRSFFKPPIVGEES